MAAEYHSFEIADEHNAVEMEVQARKKQDASVLSGEILFQSLTDENEKREDEIVRIRNLHKTYLLGLEGVPALRGVSLKVYRGEFLCILGKSGGGKTSLLNCIGTIDKPTKGDIYICGKRVSSKTPDAEVASLRLNNIGFCFQTFNLISSMTAVENVELPMILEGRRGGPQMRERALSLLEEVGLRNRAKHLPSQLSGGEQQRVTISRAISNDPDLLLLDEPTGDLDTVNSSIVLNLLLRLNKKQGMTLIMVTHDVSLKYLSNRVVHMLDGKISRIEEISEAQRRDAEENLNRTLSSGKDKSPFAEEEFEIRDPHKHYSFHRFAEKFKQLKLSEQNIDIDQKISVES